MAKLILSMDGLVLKEIALTKERTTIGRKPHNDIQIDNLAVSGEHAVIVTILNDSFLEDLGSTNGTSVNGQTIKKHFLQTNDVIELGKYKLKYVNETAAPGKAPEEFERTMVLRPNAMMSQVSSSPSAATSELVNTAIAPPPVIPSITSSQPLRPMSESQALRLSTSQPVAPTPNTAPSPISGSVVGRDGAAAIQVLSGTLAGRELVLTKALTTLGATGKQVAVITQRPQGYFITHVEGDKFPVINGHVIDVQAHPLRDHDIIELAGVKMEFFFKG
ncbi:MAG TPA: FHA domain-containing protein [Burkholderiales bacterium]